MSRKAYNPAEVESKWYQYWMENKVFRSIPDDREAYTIVIPPPNVTGILHMGHILNNTIQDILIRRARMLGKNACWVPGTDHAAIATESKVVNLLREKGISKGDIGREEFLKHCFEWKDKYGGIIIDQLKKMGASCDWDRERFTMEPKLNTAVTEIFNIWYEKGYIYRDWKIVNWDPKAQTTLSNEEVLRKEVQSNLYYVKYKLLDSEDFVTVATTRPETIMGDTAICVHPDDPRYQHLHGKKVLVPMINREVPIICDDYIDMDFGTGVLKVTPAHDTNDYEIGQRHQLEIIDVFNADGTISEAGQIFVGEDRFIVRKKVAKLLEEKELLLKTEQLTNNVGYSERNADTVVEPRLSLQWFVKMDEIVKPALENVLNDEIQILPNKFKNVYKHWLENIRDWPISRQLWWGHQIPVWYYGEEFVVARSEEEALEKARLRFSNATLQLSDLKQDNDVLDTWFSSMLWPISVFDGFEEDKSEFNYYYPTNVLVTGWDIIFFWVARMIFAGYEFTPTFPLADGSPRPLELQKPFKDVYFTGMVRDNQRRKMSKSLGNSPDPLQLIADYGADGVRFGMMSCSSAGNDLLFDDKLCDQGKKFSNKIWNAFGLVQMWAENAESKPNQNQHTFAWFEAKLNEMIVSVDKSLEEYRISEALMNLYNFVWNDFFSTYLEYVKPNYGDSQDKETLDKTLAYFEKVLQVLHPFMPFITEELWQELSPRTKGESINLSSWPKAENFDVMELSKGEYSKEIISAIRDIRLKNKVKNADKLKAYVLEGNEEIYEDFLGTIIKLGGLESLTKVSAEISGAESFIVKGQQFFVELSKDIDIDAKRAELQKELDYTKGFVLSVEKKLANERFVQGAPEQVIANERQKLADGLAKIKLLEESLQAL
ncbi:MAG: valine--tRNA ligase [Chitinophagales bacterium]|nr:valine--tRNA ligase [Chitinophagales bacterium]